MACAGDQLIYEVTLTDLRAEGAVVDAKAFLNGELLADAEIVFAHLDNSRANQIFGPKNFVFTQQLLGVLDLAKAQARAARLRSKPSPKAVPKPTVKLTSRSPSPDPPRAGRNRAKPPYRDEGWSWSIGENLSSASGLGPHDRRSRAIIKEAVRLG